MCKQQPNGRPSQNAYWLRLAILAKINHHRAIILLRGGTWNRPAVVRVFPWM